MTTKFNRLIPVLLFFLVYNYTPSIAQEKTLPLQEKTEPEITYSVTDVPKKIEAATIYLKNLRTIISPAPEIVKIETTYTYFEKYIQDLKTETDTANLDKKFTRNLKDLKQRWEVKHQQILEWQKEIENRSAEIDNQKMKLDNILSIWKRTYDNAREKKAPQDLLENIRQIRKQLKKVAEEFNSRLKTLLSYQNRISKVSLEFDEFISKINDTLNKRRTKILTRDSSPIWNLLIEPPDTVSFGEQIANIWDLYSRSISDFVVTKSDSFAYNAFLLLLVILFIIGLKHFSHSIEEDDEQIQFAIKLLDRPYSVALLVFFIFSSLFYTDAPDILKSFFKILIFIPLLRILFHISNPLLKPPMYGLTIIFFLTQISKIAVADSLLGRFILLLITLLTIAGILWIIKKKTIENILEGKKTLPYVVLGIKAALGLITITLISNVIGYVALADLLVSGTINILYITIILVTGYGVLIALTILFLHTKPARKLNVVCNQSDKILRSARKIIFLFALILWAYIALKSYIIYEPVIDGISSTLKKPWTIGTFSISLANILLFILSIWLAVIIARAVRFFLEGDVLPRLKLPRGVPGAISALTTYTIIGLGIIIALISIGLDLSKLTILVGALGVGIGFGMQDLVNNFISGLILIFERPIQVGDAVQVGDIQGRVKTIGIRSSIIRDWSGADIIVPNGHLISNKLTNWTMTDQLRRIEIKVGVMYGSDVNKVMEILLNCAKTHPKILTRPVPYVLFQNFGESYLEFELRCWTSDFGAWIDIRSEIRVAINNTFEKEGIVIPYPQRDIHIITDKTEENDIIRRKKRSGQKNNNDTHEKEDGEKE